MLMEVTVTNMKEIESLKTGQIEVYARDIKDFPEVFGKDLIPKHMFILVTYSTGKQIIVRGGPEGNNWHSMFTDDIKVVGSPYEKNLVHLFPDDYFTPDKLTKLPHSTIFKGSDDRLERYIQAMHKRSAEINEGRYDYKLPLCEASACSNQNSNTVVKDILEHANLPFILPRNTDGTKIWAPGRKGTIKETALDWCIKNLDRDALTTWVEQSHNNIFEDLKHESLSEVVRTLTAQDTTLSDNIAPFQSKFPIPANTDPLLIQALGAVHTGLPLRDQLGKSLNDWFNHQFIGDNNCDIKHDYGFAKIPTTSPYFFESVFYEMISKAEHE